MAKLTLTDVASGYQSSTAQNANNDLIETAMENTLSRDGTSPNTMSADLDLNSNDLLNVNSLNTQALTIAGTSIVAGSTLTVPAASSVPYTHSGTGGVLRNVEAKLEEWVSVADFGATTSETAANNKTYFEAALAAGSIVIVPPGNWAIDTFEIPSDTVLWMFRGAELDMTAHATTHNPVIRMGTSSAGVSNAGVMGGKINGDKANQTGASDEWSPGVMIWGSDDCFVEGVEINDCQGDGVTIGYDTGRLTPSNRCRVKNCELYDNARQQIAVTYGSEFIITRNRVSGQIDIEVNAGAFANKSGIISHNTGRLATENLDEPRISDLVISTSTANTDGRHTWGIDISHNHCFWIKCQYNSNLRITENTIVGSGTSQTRLLEMSGVDESLVANNKFIVNSTVATNIVEVIRTRAGTDLMVVNNQVENEAIVFHNYDGSFGAEPAATGHYFFGNQLTGTGNYRGGACQAATEHAKYRLDYTAGTPTLTLLSGVPANGIQVSNTGNDLIIGTIGGSGAIGRAVFETQCNGSAAASTSLTDMIFTQQTLSGSNRQFTLTTDTPTAGVAINPNAFLTSSGTGTFIFDAWF